MMHVIKRFLGTDNVSTAQEAATDTVKTGAGTKPSATGVVGMAPSSGTIPPAVGTTSPKGVPPHPSQLAPIDVSSADPREEILRAVEGYEAALKHVEQHGGPAESIGGERALIEDVRALVGTARADEAAISSIAGLGKIRETTHAMRAAFETAAPAELKEAAPAPLGFERPREG